MRKSFLFIVFIFSTIQYVNAQQEKVDMDVVNKIKGVKTTSKMGHSDVPVEDVVINSVSVDESVG